MGTSFRSSAVAGAGTGMMPWAQRTWPLPTWTGEASTRSGANSRISRHTALTSARASMVPTSWKWISSTGTPWTLLSASAIRRYTARTSSRTASGSVM